MLKFWHNVLDLPKVAIKREVGLLNVESLNSILLSRGLEESSSAVQGARWFEGRPGVYLHRDANRHLCESYIAYVRWAQAWAYLGVLLEVIFDQGHSPKAGKSTNQIIFAKESVRLVAVHLRLLTKATLHISSGRLQNGDKLESLHFLMVTKNYHTPEV